MLYTGMIEAFIIVFILSAVGSLVLNMVFRFFGKKGYLGNLYPNVRGGIPRAIGLVPFIILCFFFLPEYNTLVLIMGLFAFLDDVLGRTPSPIGIECSLHCWYSLLTFLICSRDQPVWLQSSCLL